MDYTPNQILAIYMILLCSGYLYNLVVDVVSRYLPTRIYRSSVAVVVGTAMTLGIVGLVTGSDITLIYFGAFAMSGLPMILGDFKRGEQTAG